MRTKPLHSWDVSAHEAVELQRSLAASVNLDRCDVETIERVAGADVSFDNGCHKIYAAVVVLELPALDVIAASAVVGGATFPYLSGLLSFGEARPVLKAWDRLPCKPDALLLDGQGLAHPRRIGLASHLGLWLEIPTLGCAKSVLVGSYQDPAPEAGNHTPLVDNGEVVGVALGTN